MTTPIPETFSVEFQDQVVTILTEFGTSGGVHGILYFDGALDAARVARATRLVMDAEPILGCVFEEVEGQPRWRRRGDLDEVGVSHLVETPDAEAAIHEVVAARHNPRADLLFHTRLLRQPGCGDTLLISCSHCVADGTAALELMYRLAEVYTRLGTEPNLTLEPNLTGNRHSFQWLTRFSFKERLRVLGAHLGGMRQRLFPRLSWGLLARDGRGLGDAPERPCQLFHALPDATVARLEALGREHRATLNDVLLAAFCRAYQQLAQPTGRRRIEVLMPVNMRRFLPLARADSVCNLGGFIYLNIGTRLGETFAETLELITAEMKRQKRMFMGLGDQFFAKLLDRYSFAKKRKLLGKAFAKASHVPVSPCYSNVGVIDDARLAFDGRSPERFALAGHISRFPVFLIAMWRYRGTVTLSLGFDEADVPRERMQLLLEQVERGADA